QRDGDELALLGIDQHAWPLVSLIIGRERPRFESADEAARWLVDPPPTGSAGEPARRFVAVGPTELPRLTAAFRKERGDNLAVFVGRGAFLLAVSALARGEQSENPLDDVVRTGPPPGLEPVAARLGEAVELLGWVMTDAAGQPARTMSTRRSS